MMPAPKTARRHKSTEKRVNLSICKPDAKRRWPRVKPKQQAPCARPRLLAPQLHLLMPILQHFTGLRPPQDGP